MREGATVYTSPLPFYVLNSQLSFITEFQDTKEATEALKLSNKQ